MSRDWTSEEFSNDNKISLQEQIEFMSRYQETMYIDYDRMPYFEAMLASLKELEQMQEKCRWHESDGWISECGVHNNYGMFDDFLYCPYCGKEIKWQEE